MSSTKLSVVSVLVAVVLASACAYWLRRERNAEAAALRLANAQLRREAFLQQQAGAASASAPPATATAPAEPRTAAARESATDAGATDYRFQGQATPVDTLQTMAWALDRGDVEFMVRLITFDEPARAKAEAYRASLPAEVQAKWPTVDALAATLLSSRGINHPYPRSDLLARATVEPVGTDRVQLRLPGTPKDKEVYQKADGVWKWVITEALVDAYLQNVARKSLR